LYLSPSPKYPDSRHAKLRAVSMEVIVIRPQFVNGSRSEVSVTGTAGSGTLAMNSFTQPGISTGPPSPAGMNFWTSEISDDRFDSEMPETRRGVPQSGESRFFSNRHFSTAHRGAPSPRTASV